MAKQLHSHEIVKPQAYDGTKI